MKISLTVIGGKQAGKAIPVRGTKFLIGRGEECHLRPQSHLVSRKHCAVLVQEKENKVIIEDFGSTNGTFVNGQKIQQQQELKNGDRIKVGLLELELSIPVGVVEPKHPPVQPVPAATVRTAASVPASEADLDISSWLADENGHEGAASFEKSADEPAVGAAHDTISGKPSDDTTTTMPADHTQRKNEKEKEKKPSGKIPGQFKRATKPVAESSRSAAEDMLRQFFPRKKS
jgi:pSer/pThr/pTyr-binding forkhead associated (FHA) protein